jgi:hypothetical protein
MRRKPNVRSVVELAVLLTGMLAVSGTVRGQGVSVALTPLSQRVVPGSLVHIDITLVEAGSPINAFDAYVGFDPAAMTPVPRVPIGDQVGLLMTGACPDQFHRFGAGNETPMDTVTVVLLCAGVSVTGPGQIYSLQFQASMTPQVTYVRLLPGLRFYNEGLYVNPVFATDAIIGIGMDPPTSVDPGATPNVLGLQVAPNPTRGDAVFTVSSDQDGTQGLVVSDLLGRVVRRFDDTVATPGIRTVAWDGRDAMGNRLPSGIYFVTLDVAGRSASKRVLLVR